MRPLLPALLLLTATAQAQFQILPTPTTADLRGIHAVSPEIAWASGTNGTVLRTTDAGAHWALCPVPPGADKLDFRGIQAFDAQTAIVMSSGKGDLSRLYKTTDACATWTLVFTNPDLEGFWDAIKFTDPKRSPKDKDFGMLVGDPTDGHFAVFLTFDRGEHWERQLKQSPPSQPGETVFAASNSSLIINGIQDRAVVTGGPEGARLLCFTVHADDMDEPSDRDAKVLPGAREFYFFGKRRWSSLPLPIPKSETSGAFSLAGNLYGPPEQIVVGGDYKRPDRTSGTALFYAIGKRKEFGWHPAQTPPHGYRSSVAYSPDTKTWITVGPNGTDISTDDGRNWRPLHPNPEAGEPPDADRNWNALSLPYVVGPHGRIGKLRPTALQPRSH